MYFDLKVSDITAHNLLSAVDSVISDMLGACKTLIGKDKELAQKQLERLTAMRDVLTKQYPEYFDTEQDFSQLPLR